MMMMMMIKTAKNLELVLSKGDEWRSSLDQRLWFGRTDASRLLHARTWTGGNRPKWQIAQGYRRQYVVRSNLTDVGRVWRYSITTSERLSRQAIEL